MNNVIRLFDDYIKYHSRLCNEMEDYYSKRKVLVHNKAMRKLIALREEIAADMDAANEVYKLLLSYENMYVQQSAASDCLNLNILVDQSLQILKDRIKNGDRMHSMAAKRVLLIWEGKLDPNSPFWE